MECQTKETWLKCTRYNQYNGLSQAKLLCVIFLPATKSLKGKLNIWVQYKRSGSMESLVKENVKEGSQWVIVGRLP